MITLLFLCLIVCGCLKIQLIHAQCSDPVQADTDRQMCSQIVTSTIMANGITCTRSLSSPYSYTATCDSPTTFDYCRLPSGTTQIQFMIQPNGNTAPGGLNSFSTCVTDSAAGFNSCVGMGQAVTWSSLPATPFSFIGKSTISVRSPPAGTDSSCALAYNFVILGPNDPIPSSSALSSAQSSALSSAESSPLSSAQSSALSSAESSALSSAESSVLSSAISSALSSAESSALSSAQSSALSSSIIVSSTAVNQSLSSSIIESSTAINQSLSSSMVLSSTALNSTYTNTTSTDERFDKTKTINSIVKGNVVIIGSSTAGYFIISILISMFGL